MTVAHAQTLVPDLIIEDANPEEDEAALARLALWCTRYSPLVTPNQPDTIFIDVAGSSHLFKGEAALLDDLRARLSAAHLRGRTAIADTPGCAWAVSHYGRCGIVPPGRASRCARQPADSCAAPSGAGDHRACAMSGSSGLRSSRRCLAPLSGRGFHQMCCCASTRRWARRLKCSYRSSRARWRA